MQIYNVFHPWLLHLDDGQPLPGQAQELPPPVNAEAPEEEQEWEVDEVVDSRMNRAKTDTATKKRGLLEYKLQYRGYEGWNETPSWQPYWDAAGCPHLVADYHHRYPRKPGPHMTFQTPTDWEPLL
ncbi:hypothetical protein K402DRAFT_387701, partial [Aulographum hederae CBS 113979]